MGHSAHGEASAAQPGTARTDGRRDGEVPYSTNATTPRRAGSPLPYGAGGSHGVPVTPMGLEVVATGSWVYDGIAESPVWTVRADFDFWYEIAAADGELEPGETPQLNDDGVTYYVAFREPGDGRFWPHEGGFPTLNEAQRAAARQVPTAIQWDTR